MKTAILKTNFWDEPAFDRLHIDSKMVLFYLFANPFRGLHRINRINVKVCSAHTGLTVEHIQKGIEQLVEEGFILFHPEGWYLLLKNYVEPAKGRFTKQAIEKEESEIPDYVKEFFAEKLREKEQVGYRYDTGIIPEYIYNNKDKNKDKDKKEGQKNDLDFDPLFDLFWDEYPRKVKKQVAREKFKKVLKGSKDPEKLFEAIMEALRRYKKTKQWQEKEFIPHPTTWLNQRRWEDEIEVIEPKKIIEV